MTPAGARPPAQDDDSLALAALEAALDAIGAPAFVSRANGAVSHTSASGRALLARDNAETKARIRDAIRHPRGDTYVAELRGQGAVGRYLVVLRDLGRFLDLHLATVAERWKLTARERDVLSRLVAGELGKVIAGQLRLHPGSVERHVSAIYRKSGCTTRGRLFAKFWTST